MGKKQLPKREDILRRMWALANAGAEDAVRLACFPQEEGLDKLDLDALTEFKRGSNGVVELRFTDRTKLLEKLLEATDQSGADQMEGFLQRLEEE